MNTRIPPSAAAEQSAIPEQFQRGLALHQSGQLAQASAIYEEIIRREPACFEALHMSAVLAGQTGNYRKAVGLLNQAIDVQPRNAAPHRNRAFAFKNLGEWKAALADYERSIELDPGHAQAHYHRGDVLRALGRMDSALASYERAALLKPNYAEAYYGRGIILNDRGDHEAARASYERAIGINPRFVEAYINRGVALETLGQPDAALTSYDQGISAQPHCAELYYYRANLLKTQCRFAAAIADYERAIALKPAYAEAYLNRGVALQNLKRHGHALEDYERAIAARPDYAEAYCNRGGLLFELRRHDAALASLDRAIEMRPDYAEAHYNRGRVLIELERQDEAIESCNQAIRLKPDHADAYVNRGALLAGRMQLNEALQSYDKALKIGPDGAAAHLNKSILLLLSGDFAQGWMEYEWRVRLCAPAGGIAAGDFAGVPLWNGSQSLAGKMILVRAEQGLGDTIQFCRYAKLLADRGATVILEAQKPLLGLLAQLEGVSRVLAHGGEELPAVDYHCPLMSLPYAFKTTVPTIPAEVPYLRGAPEKIAHWRATLGETRKLRVGLVWSGGFRPDQPELWAVNKRRNIPLRKFAPLRHPDIEFHSLQKGQPAESELAELLSEGWSGPTLNDSTHLLNDFTDTAALMENLDLIISVDTSTAHLAGALGRPVWLLNRFDTCWRWLLDRSDSPWYPTARLYRQSRAGDWDDVMQRVQADLFALAGND